jgi:hypothetical protein
VVFYFRQPTPTFNFQSLFGHAQFAPLNQNRFGCSNVNRFVFAAPASLANADVRRSVGFGAISLAQIRFVGKFALGYTRPGGFVWFEVASAVFAVM